MARCHCNKRLYTMKVDALIALADIQRKDREQAAEKRVYRCPYGQGYHLTSQPKRLTQIA